MFSYFQHPDWGTRTLLFVFTVGSACLSAYCGWSLAAESGFIVKCFFAAILGCIPLALGNSVIRSSRYLSAGNVHGFQRMLVIAILLVPLNLLTDYGASSVIRDETTVANDNANTKQTDLRDSLARKRKELATLKQHDTGILSPDVYDARILALKNRTENGRNIWQRSKQCTNTTVASSQAVCEGIATALANKAIAQRRLELLPEIQARESEITTLEKQFKAGEGFESNPAAAQIKKMVSWVTLRLDHSKTEVSWGENSLMLITTLALTAAISFFGWEMGQRHGALADAPQSRWADNWQLEDRRQNPPPKTTPQAGRETIVLQSETIRQDDSTKALEMALERLRSKYQSEAVA